MDLTGGHYGLLIDIWIAILVFWHNGDYALKWFPLFTNENHLWPTPLAVPAFRLPLDKQSICTVYIERLLICYWLPTAICQIASFINRKLHRHQQLRINSTLQDIPVKDEMRVAFQFNRKLCKQFDFISSLCNYWIPFQMRIITNLTKLLPDLSSRYKSFSILICLWIDILTQCSIIFVHLIYWQWRLSSNFAFSFWACHQCPLALSVVFSPAPWTFTYMPYNLLLNWFR